MALGLLRFTNALGGTSDFIYPGPAIDMQSPASAGAVNGTVYLYYAQSLDMTEWEIGSGAYTSSSGTFARTTITANDLGTTAKVSFTNPPQVIVFDNLSSYATLAFVLANYLSPTAAQAWSTAQKAQAQKNIYEGPTGQQFFSGSGTYTTPANCLYIKVRGKGGGGGGAGSGTSPGAAVAGGTTTFGTSLLTANGGAQAVASGKGAGGTASGGTLNLNGNDGGNGSGITNEWGARGGGAQGGIPGQPNQSAGGSAATNSGCGGGGAGCGATVNSGGGGGEGGYFETIISNPLATYSYAVGAAGTAGTAGTSGSAGGAGAAGWIVIEEFYGS